MLHAAGPHDSEAKPIAEGQVAVKLLSNAVSCNPDSDLTKPDSQYCGRPASGGTTSPSPVCAGVSTTSNPMVDAPSESHCSPSENSTGVVSPQISESNRSSKVKPCLFQPFGIDMSHLTSTNCHQFLGQSLGRHISHQYIIEFIEPACFTSNCEIFC